MAWPLQSLDAADRARLRGRLLERLGAGEARPTLTTVSHIARAVR